MHVGFHGPMLWHPIGFLVTTLAVTAIIVSASNDSHQDIYYSEGVYYEKQSDGSYKAVPAPPDAQIPALPDGYTNVGEVDGTQYFYYQGDFYVVSGDKYVVAKAPEGAVVPYVPEAAQPSTVDGKQYYMYEGTWYKAKSQDGDTVYQVTGPPS